MINMLHYYDMHVDLTGNNLDFLLPAFDAQNMDMQFSFDHRVLILRMIISELENYISNS